MNILMCMLLCLGSVSPIETAKESLFTAWSNSNAIAMVSFGLATPQETAEVKTLLQSIHQQIIEASGAELSKQERLLEIPFLLGMIEGIQVAKHPELAPRVTSHLKDLDESMHSIAASRIWRMRLQSALAIGDEFEIDKSIHALQSVSGADEEDLTVGVLVKIQQAFNKGEISTARYFFSQHDERLSRTSSNQLRIAFACGYAKHALTTSESLHGFFYIAATLQNQGINQQEIDSLLVSLIDRLPISPVVHAHSEDVRIANLATRMAIRSDLEQLNFTKAAPKLMQLAQKGDVHAAEQLLKLHNYKEVSVFLDDACAIVLANPEQCDVDVNYWRLFAANRSANQGKFDKAFQYLESIESSSQFALDGKRLQNQLQSMDIVGIIETLSSTPNHQTKHVVNELMLMHAASMPHIALHCIKAWHEQGDQVALWVRQTAETLAASSSVVPSGQQAELLRLLGYHQKAASFFNAAIKEEGISLQYVAGVADCTQDAAAMRRVKASASPTGESSYWHWLSQLRLLQWHVAAGGNQQSVLAKVNRLRKKDASLGGANFISQFNTLCQVD